MNSGSVTSSYDLLISAIDLTRACCASENYLRWLSHQSDALHGSAQIANYLANAALAFEERAHPHVQPNFDVFDARDNLADILMASAPLSCEELRAVVTGAIREARPDSPHSGNYFAAEATSRNATFRAATRKRRLMSKHTKRFSRSREASTKRWRHRVAFTANVYLDIETDSADTRDQDLERLAIEAVRRGSKENRDLPLDEVGIDIPTLPGGRLYAEPNLNGGLENFSIEDCYGLIRTTTDVSGAESV